MIMHRNIYVPGPKEVNLYLHKYPKFLLLFIMFLVAYLMFSGREYGPLHDSLISMGYFGTFIAGCFFTYSFTTAPASVAFLIMAKSQNIYLAALIGGTGALLMDLVIFRFMRHSFNDEIKKLAHEELIGYLHQKTPVGIKRYVLPVLGGLIIASPLPDEIGVTLIAASKSISLKIFTLISYIMNTLGIFFILMIGSSL